MMSNSPRTDRSDVKTGGSVVSLPGLVLEVVEVVKVPVRRAVLPPGPFRGDVVRKEAGAAVFPAATPWHHNL